MTTKIKLTQTNGQPWVRAVEFDSPAMSELWTLMTHATVVNGDVLYVQPGLRLPDGSATPLSHSPSTGEPLQYDMSKADLKAVGVTSLCILKQDLRYDPEMAAALAGAGELDPEVTEVTEVTEATEEAAEVVEDEPVEPDGEAPAEDTGEFDPEFDPNGAPADDDVIVDVEVEGADEGEFAGFDDDGEFADAPTDE